MYNEYLTEGLLRQFCKERFYKYNLIFNRNLEPGVNIRPDIKIPELNLVIEFNGYLHYTSAKTIINDLHKQDIYFNKHLTLIEIPYFIQLDGIMVDFLFSKYITNLEPFNNYPHGFIDKKAALPCDFCELGINRFRNDLQKFSIVCNDIINSLRLLSKSPQGDPEVLSPSLFKILIPVEPNSYTI